MNRALAAILMLAVVVGGAALGEENACAAFPAALEACAPATCRTPHPLMQSFTIEHSVAGEDAGACAYTQSMPGNMLMRCRFTEAGRREHATAMRDQMSAPGFAMSASSAGQESYMTRECTLVGPNGAAIPWGDSRN